MKLQLRTNGKDNWYVLLARNGQVMLTSETYASRRHARRAMRRAGMALCLMCCERE